MTGRLVQLSGVVVDHVYWVDRIPGPGEEAIVRRSATCAGGGFNAMVAAKRAEMAVAYAGSIGSGPFAEIVAKALEKEGIPALRPRALECDQGCCTCIVDRFGERTFVASAGADSIVTEDDLAGIPLDESDWLLLSGYALAHSESVDAMTAWLEKRASGSRHDDPSEFVFDPCPLAASIPPKSRDAALAAATWVSANRREAEILTGHADPEDSAAALALGRVGGAIVRDGANGCVLARDGAGTLTIAGHSVRATDTNGAGDAHVGAFVAMLSNTGDPQYAARFANVAAALATTGEGPSSAPELSEVLDTLA